MNNRFALLEITSDEKTMILMVLWFAAMGVWRVTIFPFAFSQAAQAAPAHPPTLRFFVGIFAVWLVAFGIMGANLILAIIYEWAAYPIIGRWARSIVNV